MKVCSLVAAMAAAVALGGSLAQAATVTANDGADLAAKIVQANGDSDINVIRCVSFRGCDFTGTLPTYTGSQRLVINGRGSTIDATGIDDEDALSATGGGTLRLVALTILGGMSGIYVEVPSDKTTIQVVDLNRVTVRGAALHGIFVNDDARAVAGIRFLARRTNVIDNGFGAADQDGVRIIETGRGQVVTVIRDSNFRENSANGFFVDERGGGAVTATISGSGFVENGENPDNPADPDDGFDVDERGGGRVLVTIDDSRFNRNADDGLDIDEDGSGSSRFDLTEVIAVQNDDQGLAFEEQLAGNLLGTITDSRVIGNDRGSQEINIRGEQSGSGFGSLVLVNTLSTKIALDGIDLDR